MQFFPQRFRRVLFTLLSVCGSFVSYSDVTNHFDMVEIAKAGEGRTDSGWELHSITNYSDDYKYALRFRVKDSYLLSPQWNEPILGVRLNVFSSTNANRRLIIQPIASDEVQTNLIQSCAYSEKKYKFTEQTFTWSLTDNIHQLRLAYDDGGGSTGWGLLWLEVITAGDSPFVPPEDPPMPPDEPPLSPESDEAFWVQNLSNLSNSNGVYSFAENAGLLPVIKSAATSTGVLSEWGAFMCSSNQFETTLKVNGGTTTTQGHYIWKDDKSSNLTGFGTYTSSKGTRSFGFVFYNDTGTDLSMRDMAVTYGQFGAKNKETDKLSFAWCLATHLIDPRLETEWIVSDSDSFVSPKTSNDVEGVVWPITESREIESLPPKIPSGNWFAIRWLDTCPTNGANAALGISAFQMHLVSAGGENEWTPQRVRAMAFPDDNVPLKSVSVTAAGQLVVTVPLTPETPMDLSNNLWLEILDMTGSVDLNKGFSYESLSVKSVTRVGDNLMIEVAPAVRSNQFFMKAGLK